MPKIISTNGNFFTVGDWVRMSQTQCSGEHYYTDRPGQITEFADSGYRVLGVYVQAWDTNIYPDGERFDSGWHSATWLELTDRDGNLLGAPEPESEEE